MWKSTKVGDLPNGAVYDQAVVPHNGGQALRISNHYVNGELHFQTYSQPTAQKVGENALTDVIASEFTFQSATEFNAIVAKDRKQLVTR